MLSVDFLLDFLGMGFLAVNAKNNKENENIKRGWNPEFFIKRPRFKIQFKRNDVLQYFKALGNYLTFFSIENQSHCFSSRACCLATREETPMLSSYKIINGIVTINWLVQSGEGVMTAATIRITT